MKRKKSDAPLILWHGGAEVCNYTYLIKYYDLCGRRAEASREEGQKTVFEMQRGRRAARRRDERGGGVEADHNGIRGEFGEGFSHAGCTHTLSAPLSERAGYRTFNGSKATTEML